MRPRTIPTLLLPLAFHATPLSAAMIAEESDGHEPDDPTHTSYSADVLLTAMTEEQDDENTLALQTRLLTLRGYDPPVYDVYTSLTLGVEREPIAPTLLLALRTCFILEDVDDRLHCLAPVVRRLDHGPTIERIVACPARTPNEGMNCIIKGMTAQIRADPDADRLLRPIAEDLLLEAYRANDVPLTELALDFGASANEVYVNGKPLLHRALLDVNDNGYGSDVLYALIERSDLNGTNSNNWETGLMVAARVGIPTWVMKEARLKTTGKLQINAQDRWGNTALHYVVGTERFNADEAIVQGFFSAYDELREKGLVDPLELNLKNDSGCRPRDYAQSDGSRKLLKKRGARRGRLFGCRRKS